MLKRLPQGHKKTSLSTFYSTKTCSSQFHLKDTWTQHAKFPKLEYDERKNLGQAISSELRNYEDHAATIYKDSKSDMLSPRVLKIRDTVMRKITTEKMKLRKLNEFKRQQV